jgi:hypothetical protein
VSSAVTSNFWTRFAPDISTMKCDTLTAFGSPLVPEVKISMYGSSGSASR